ncbi:4-coumarate--CoA ligase 1-like [Teleopsis dalmanni]|uniref:4-coumarate--CoA ligase 1-like n=1 Tax=Teleopsis dalmanni TaxID=139649 RepID=UPI0018CD3E7D|nr:4-coumarate--CoA ligase 1-like [Teleopsis dalmanni]
MELVTVYDKLEKIWSGSGSGRIFDSNKSIGEIAFYMMRSKSPTEICQISDSEDTTLTYGTAITYAIRIAQHFRKLELTQDDIVGIVAPNTTLLMPVAVACWLNCTPFQAIYPLHEENVIEHLFNITKPKVIFCDGLRYEKIKNLEDLLEPTITEHFFRPATLKYGPNQTMGLFCSSGTTGLPKAVCISNHLMTKNLGFTDRASIMFSFSTPDWTTGLLSLAINTLLGGVRIVTTKPYSPEYLMEIVIKYKVSFLGGHCPISTLERVRSQLTMAVLLNGYGTTECGGIAANIKNYKNNSVGRILPEIEIKIIDQQTGEKLAHNQVGEIYVRTSSKWSGYYGDVKATEAVLELDGWVQTGDLGYIDEENYLYLLDRSKDILKYNGRQYSPHEIEETILELSDVLDACVFGVYDDNFNDLAAAAVMKKPGAKLTKEEIVKYVKEQHEDNSKHLNYGVFLVDEIPKNANGYITTLMDTD